MIVNVVVEHGNSFLNHITLQMKEEKLDPLTFNLCNLFCTQ